MKKISFWNSRLQKETIFLILFATTFVLISFGIVDYFIIKSRMLKELHEISRTTATRLANSIATPLYDVNTSNAEEIINAEMADKRLFAVLVKDQNGNSVTKQINTMENLPINMEISRKRDKNWNIVKIDKDDISGKFITCSEKLIKRGKAFGIIEIFYTPKLIDEAMTIYIVENIAKAVILDFILVILLSFILKKKVIRPITLLVKLSEMIAKGNYHIEIKSESKDEIGELLKNFEIMRLSIKNLMNSLEVKILQLENEIEDHQRTESERERLTIMLESTSDLVSMFTIEGRVIYMNRAGRKMAGWGEGDDITKKIIPDFHPEWARRMIEEKGIPAAIEHGVWEGETALSGSKGGEGFEIPVSQVIMSHKSIDGEIKYISTIMRNMSEYRHAEKMENEARLLAQEMALAKNIQTGLLPSGIKNIHPDFEIAASMLTADKVSGDFYDICYDKTGNLWFAIGDVSGHGVTAGLIMMMAQTVHTTVTTNLACDAQDVVIIINEILYKNVHERLKESNFMTFNALKYLGSGKFQHAGAHLSIIIYRIQSGDCELIRTKGVYLNFKKDISKTTKNAYFQLGEGDIMVLYTDGLTEAENMDNKMLDIKGFVEIIKKYVHNEPDTMKENIMADVLKWCDYKIEDDMTIVIVRRKEKTFFETIEIRL
ncbi:MAG: SpoIIE family protein phosphatase [Desulfamplus sp.]|nr:SpoIIE family protein phosphatase [Desulfamplus sp.]